MMSILMSVSAPFESEHHGTEIIIVGAEQMGFSMIEKADENFF